MSKISPFDIVRHLNEKTTLDFDVKEYNPFMINRSLSFHQQTIYFANLMNKFFSLDKDIQYNFHKNGIPKGKRFGKWEKKTEASDTVKLISHIYNVNEHVANQYASLLNEEQLQQLSEKFDKGGRNGAKSR